MIISKFRQTGIHEILIYLLEEDLKITDIFEKIPQQSAYRAVNILLELKLVEIRRGDFNAKFYFLTEKGKKIAAKLAEIEKILQEED